MLAVTSAVGALPPVWRASELACSPTATLPTGFAALDAQLPGAGWPLGALIELLYPPGFFESWRLVLPALVQRLQGHAGRLVLVGAAPSVSTAGRAGLLAPFAPGLQAQGLQARRLLWVPTAQRVWACEQALRCTDVAAVMAWLPQEPGAQLRRLHLAVQEGGQLLFAWRPATMQHDSSAAPLRLLLGGAPEAGAAETGSAHALPVRVLKRRGPTLVQGLSLPLSPGSLARLLALRGRPVLEPAPADRVRLASPAAGATPIALHRSLHVVDRLAAPA